MVATNTIDTAFTSQFEADVHLAYQRMGSKLTNTVRRKNNIVGKDTTFQILAKGAAGTKSRNGQVPVMNLVHTNVTCTLADYYAGEYVDKLDELKIEHDERQVVATSIAAALGRKSDEILVTVMDAATTNQTASAGAVTQPKVEEIYEFFGDNDVPDDGGRCLSVSPQGWTDLMGISAFADRDYVPESEMPWRGAATSMKRWFSFMCFTFSGWSKSGAVRTSMAWHKTALGFGSGQEVQMDITWQGKEQAHLLVGSLSQGAVEIDSDGVYQLLHTES